MLAATLLLLIPCTALALTAPFRATNANVICHRFEGTPMSPPSCGDLLARIRDLSWVQRRTTFGTYEPPPGAVPRTESDAICRFQIQARRTSTESIRLVEYFQAFEEINQRCIRTSTMYNGGSVRVGMTGNFVVVLNRQSLRQSLIPSALNGTLVPGDLTGLAAAEVA